MDFDVSAQYTQTVANLLKNKGCSKFLRSLLEYPGILYLLFATTVVKITLLNAILKKTLIQHSNESNIENLNEGNIENLDEGNIENLDKGNIENLDEGTIVNLEKGNI